MTRNEALEYIHEHTREYADEAWGRDKSGRGWVCPLCGSGSGDKGTGITTKDGIHFTCWAGCFQSADLIDIIGLVEHIPETDHGAKFEAARRAFGLDDALVDQGRRREVKAGAVKPLDKAPGGEPVKVESLEPFFLRANKHLPDTAYHRGLTLGTLNRFKVGFIEEWRHPKAPHGVPATPRLIIPTGAASYIARDTRATIPPDQEQFKKQQVGSRGKSIFNGGALETAKGPVFITEGELDAMSVIDVGGEAVTAGSAGQWRNVFEAVKAHPQKYPVIVALDCDETGGKNGRELKKELAAAGMAFIDYKPPMGCKDANEALMKDRAIFAESVKAAIGQAMRPEEERQEETRQEYLSTVSASADLQGFVDRIKTGEQTPPFPTGFPTLDKILNGGLRPGLYVLGAIQSLGKTAFSMQMMDNIAASGHDVLVFSLEMARSELIARSVSRITYELSRKAMSPGRMAYSTVELLSGSCYEKDGAEGKRRIMDAVMAYSKYSDHIFIVEGVGDVTVGQMLETTQRHIQITGRRPIVLCDYLQIVPAEDTKGRTDKQNIDYNVVSLKRLSRDLSIPVFMISSFNRQNYLEPLNPSAFKESGAVEYSADVLIGLQYQGMEYRVGDEKEGQRGRRVAALISRMNRRGEEGKPQGIHVKVMKNRTGIKKGVYLSFFPAFNFFECDADADEQERKADEEWARSVENAVKDAAMVRRPF